MKKVQDLLNARLSSEVYSVFPEQSVLSAAQFMRIRNLGAVPVIQNNILLGIVSERDMLNKVLSPGYDPRDVSVREIMSTKLIIVSPDEDLRECLEKMRTHHCRHLPVVEQGIVTGMISLRDILGLDEAELLDHYLWDRSMRVS